MKVEYRCMKCKEKFIVERSGVMDRSECYNELVEIGKSTLFPYFEKHYSNSTDYRSIVFDGWFGDDYDFKVHDKLAKKIGIDLCYPVVVCRTSWSKRVGFAT